MNNRKYYILPLLAVLMVLTLSVKSASAYFTTYVTAKGGRVLAFNPETEIDEEYSAGMKTIRVRNTGDVDVFVRLTYFYPSNVTVAPDKSSSAKWKHLGGAAYEYTEKVAPGASTEDFKLAIDLSGATAADIETFNVIVVYEFTPAFGDTPDWNSKDVIEIDTTETVTPEPVTPGGSESGTGGGN